MDDESSSRLNLKHILIVIRLIGAVGGATAIGRWADRICTLADIPQMCLDEAGNDQSAPEPASQVDPGTGRQWLLRNVATRYCLDSGGDTSAVKAPAYTYQDCGNPSGNLRRTFDPSTSQIRNVATGYCLDSGGETAVKASVFTYQNCAHPSDNLKWDLVA